MMFSFGSMTILAGMLLSRISSFLSDAPNPELANSHDEKLNLSFKRSV